MTWGLSQRDSDLPTAVQWEQEPFIPLPRPLLIPQIDTQYLFQSQIKPLFSILKCCVTAKVKTLLFQKSKKLNHQDKPITTANQGGFSTSQKIWIDKACK